MELIKVENGVGILNPVASGKIAHFEREMKALKEQEEELKAAILAAMEEQNVLKVDTPELTITYVAPSLRETFDSKRLKEELPELYDDFCKLTRVKASIRLKVK